jgi:predicted AAA+ superfamily ATPase
MKRIAEQKLLEWRNKADFKPLILMGARQVGKTWLMKNLGSAHFKNCIYINFEKEPALRQLFEQNLQVDRIVKTLELFGNQKIQDGESLIIFDEIQEAPKALTCLKYFAEDRPGLHVIAAGSLLGVTLDRGSFPVGKVQFLTIRPMNFEEFLWAANENALSQLLNQMEFDLISVFREQFISQLRLYYFVGGMPAVVAKYLESSNLDAVQEVQNNILTAYKQDFSKHAPSSLIPKILDLWDGIVSQLSKENKKFVYGLIKTGARAREYELAIDWLVNYGLIHKIYAVNKIALPLAAYRDLKSFKLYTLDSGLLVNMSKMSSGQVLHNASFFQEFKGALTEQFVLQELISLGFNNISYWTNESGTAELDFMTEKNGTFYPLEIKATENLKSKSLKVFHDKYPEIHCLRCSLSNFRDEKWMSNIPLYALARYLDNENKT